MIHVRGQGSSSKGGSASKAVSSPDTLKSSATARVIDLLCEGPIVGLVDGLKSVYLNDTQLQADDDSYNFDGVTIETRLGLPDQDPLAGFPAVETEVAVSTQVVNATPVVRTVSGADLTAIRVTLQTPAMIRIDDDGSTYGTSIAYRIDVKPSGGSWTTAVTATKKGKTTSSYQWAHRIELSGTAPWDVRVVRITADSSSDKLQNDLYWSSYTAIQDYRLSYPDCALLGVTAPAESFGGNIPTRKYLIDAQVIDVPTNYDPITRTYTGIWDGTFKQAWTDNPAWIFRALATHERYGLGRYADGLVADKWTLYQIAQYCDGLVDDGFGGHEPRFTCNIYINSPGKAFEVLSTLATLFAGMVYWGPNGLTATCDMPADPVKIVTRANVLNGEINYSGSALSARHTVALVTWKDPNDLFRDAIEVVEDADAIQKWGWREVSITALGCTSRGMARRVGKWLLDTEASATETASWQASWDHTDVMPGDIVVVADNEYAGIALGGRISGVVTSGPDAIGIELDRSIVLDSGTSYKARVVLADGSVAERVVATAAGTVDTLVFSGDVLDPAPVIGAVWAIESSLVKPRQFRVVARTEDEPNIFTITALLHDPDKYTRVEDGIVLEESIYSTIPGGVPARPSNLAAVGSVQTVGGGVKKTYTLVSWTAADDPRVVYYEAEVQASSAGSWESLGITSGVSLEVFDLVNGVYSFRVRSADAFDRKSGWLTITDVDLDFGSDFAFEVGDNTVSAEKLTIPVRDYLLSNIQAQIADLYTQIDALAAVSAGADARSLKNRRELRTEYADGLAAITETMTTVVDVQLGALAQYSLMVEAETEAGSATGLARLVALSAPSGVDAEYQLRLATTIGGTLSYAGFSLQIIGATARAVFDVDQFVVRAAGGTQVPFFYDGGTDTLYLNTKVQATKIEATTLSAITGDMGTLTVGKIQSPDGEFKIDATNKTIEIYRST